jgi:uncharacterized membrane protein YadS
VKLSRTLWIIPVALIAGLTQRGPAAPSAKAPARKVPVPWFIGLFVLASVAGTFLAPIHEAAPLLQTAAKTGMTLTLLLIGTSLSRASLKAVGIRPILQGLALWLVISAVSLMAISWLGA